MKPKIRDIIGQYRQMIREDGNVEPEQLKKMLSLEKVLPAKYKNDKALNEIIRLINKPMPEKKVVVEQKPDIKKQPSYIEFMELYNEGLNDKEIAEKLNAKYHQIRYLRLRNNLISNNFKIQQDKHKRVQELYMLGYSDNKIAKEVHLSQGTIFNWREKNKLPPNNEPVGGRNNGNETNDNNKH